MGPVGAVGTDASGGTTTAMVEVVDVVAGLDTAMVGMVVLVVGDDGTNDAVAVVAVDVVVVVVISMMVAVDGTMVGEDRELVALSATDVGEVTRCRGALSSLLPLMLPLLLLNTVDITLVSSASRKTVVNISTHCHSFLRNPSIFRQFFAFRDSSWDEDNDTRTATVSTIRALVVSFVSRSCLFAIK